MKNETRTKKSALISVEITLSVIWIMLMKKINHTKDQFPDKKKFEIYLRRTILILKKVSEEKFKLR
jgi:hypothetical protein